jgi:hypothetical protein
MERGMPQHPIDDSPLATVREILPSAHLLTDGPVRYLLVSGERDDRQWGSIGAFWRVIDGGTGGFLVSPDAIRSAQARGWSVERIYAYWQAHVGIAGRIMVDPQQHADTLFQVARRVGAI